MRFTAILFLIGSTVACGVEIPDELPRDLPAFTWKWRAKDVTPPARDTESAPTNRSEDSTIGSGGAGGDETLAESTPKSLPSAHPKALPYEAAGGIFARPGRSTLCRQAVSHGFATDRGEWHVPISPDPKSIVLQWNSAGGYTDPPRTTAIELVVYADGLVAAVHDPFESDAVDRSQLSRSELQDLLDFVAVEQDFAHIDFHEFQDAYANLSDGDSTTVRLVAGDNVREVSFYMLTSAMQDCPELEAVQRFSAIVARLAEVAEWVRRPSIIHPEAKTTAVCREQDKLSRSLSLDPERPL